MTVRLAALGDSITAGLGDPVSGGGCRGFAVLLADGIPATLRNFAAPGALTADVAEVQLPLARAWRPDLATVVVGVNDTLRGSFDIGLVAPRLWEVIGGLSAAGTCVLTTCLPEPGRLLRLPESLSRPLSRRIRTVNEVIHHVSRRTGAIHVHVAGDPRLLDRRMWSVDRLHPSERGHRLLAGLCFDALARAGWARGERPGAEPLNPPPTAGEQVRWMATKGVRWIWDRCGDLVPQLTRLAASEWHLTRRGLAPHLDQRAAADVAAALARLSSAAADGSQPSIAALRNT